MIIKRISKALNINHRLLSYISIETVKTPNPNFLKFIPSGRPVLGDQGTLDIPSKQYSQVSPLAQQLFELNGITRVFYGPDYLSIAKQQQMEWDALKPQLFRIISDFFESKKQLLVGNVQFQSHDIDPNDPQVVQFIKQILSSRIRPNLQEDGGDVKFIDFNQESGILRLKLVGACAGCPSSTATLKGGIEKMLTYYVKEIKEVIAEDD